MGNALGCCRAPRNDPDREAVRPRDLQASGKPGGAGLQAAASATAASSPRTSLDRRSAARTSIGWYSAVDAGEEEGEDEWHDALSDIDSVSLASALEEFEAQEHWHDSGVDEAIQVLKARGHLLPAELEALASQQRAEDRAVAAAYEGGARVVVQAAARLPSRKLERTRSQQLRAALDQPACREALAGAAAAAAQGRVLAAHAALRQLAAEAGGNLAELAELPPDALAAALPPGASLDVGRVVEEARYVGEALAALEDHSGWMCSRNDSLKVHYRHEKGTTVHSLKFSAVLAHPLEHLLALCHEFDLIVTWNKFSLASVKLAEPSIFESFVYGAQWMMKPFRHMQGLLRCRGYDLADEHKCLLVSLEDCAPEDLPEGHAPLPKEFPRRKLVNFLAGSCLKLRPLRAAPDGTPRTEGSLMLHLDPHIPYIPAFLLNFVLGVLAPYIYGQMRRVLDSSFADEAGVYPQRIREQPELYGYVRQRLASFEDELSPLSEEEAAAEAAAAKAARRRGGKRGGAQAAGGSLPDSGRVSPAP